MSHRKQHCREEKRQKLADARFAAARHQVAAFNASIGCAGDEKPRRCGDCKACCVWMAIAPDGIVREQKPAHRPCAHLCASGCGQYFRRPETCHSFMCMWLQGMLGPDDRPDKIGFILTTSEGAPGGPPVALVTRGFTSERGDHLVRELCAKLPLVIDERDGIGQVYGDDSVVDHYLAHNPQLATAVK